MRVPGGGASCLGVGRLGLGALPTLSSCPFRRAAGLHYPLAVGAGHEGAGTRHQPHSSRSCELALRAVGAARGRPGGAPLAWVWGVRGPALSHPRPLVLSGVRPGPTTHRLWVRGVRAWGTVVFLLYISGCGILVYTACSFTAVDLQSVSDVEEVLNARLFTTALEMSLHADHQVKRSAPVRCHQLIFRRCQCVVA